jgi:hypothetical protein
MVQRLPIATLRKVGYRVTLPANAGLDQRYAVVAPGNLRLDGEHEHEDDAWRQADEHFALFRQKPVPVLFKISRNGVPMGLFPTIRDKEGWIYGYFGEDRFEWAPAHFASVFRRAPASHHKDLLDAITRHFDDPERPLTDRYPVVPVTRAPQRGDDVYHWSQR